jgi:hypothetical protein
MGRHVNINIYLVQITVLLTVKEKHKESAIS